MSIAPIERGQNPVGPTALVFHVERPAQNLTPKRFT